MKEKNEAFVEKWKGELHQWEKILQQMERSESPDLAERKASLQKRIDLVKEELSL